MIIIVCLCAAPGHASGDSDSGYIPKIVAHWIKSSGGKVSQYGLIARRWVWAAAQPGLPEGGPALRATLAVRMPKSWTFKKSTGEDAKLSKIQKIGAPTEGAYQLTIDLVASSAVVELEFTEGKKTHELSLALNAEYRDPYVIRFKECPNYDIKLQPVNRAGRHLFMGWSCDETDKKIVVYVSHSADAKWAGATQQRHGERPSFQHTISKLADAPSFDASLLKITTADVDGQLVEYSLSYALRAPLTRWTITPGIAATYFAYDESLLKISIKQWGSTGKVGVAYKLFPPRWTIDLTTFMTLAVFTISPGGSPTTKFLGINGRVGFRLPIDTWSMSWTLYGGLYYWSMSVEKDAYGVKPLIGPQLFLTAGRGGDSRDRALYAYVKLASISDGSTLFDFGNRETAIGAGYGITIDPYPFVATLDIAQTAFAKGRNSMKLNTATLGVSKRF